MTENDNPITDRALREYLKVESKSTRGAVESYSPGGPVEPALESPDPNVQPVAAAGILVVHGMGNQRRGDTLTEWSLPLLKRFQWYASKMRSPATPRDLGADHDESRLTAKLLEYFNPTTGGMCPVLVREAWWADNFTALTNRETVEWSLRFAWGAIFAAATHGFRALTSRARPAGRRTMPFVLFVLHFLPAWASGVLLMLLAVAAVLVAYLFLVVALIIPPLINPVRKVIERLGGVIGDPAAMLTDETRCKDMLDVVRREIQQLACRVVKGSPIVILAHSQGAALVGGILFTADDQATSDLERAAHDAPISALVTIGSGISLLGADTDWLSAPVGRWKESKRVKRWTNIWATWDPFASWPVGDNKTDGRDRWTQLLRSRDQRVPSPDGPTERRTRNTANPLLDHQSYAKNPIETIDPIMHALLDDEPRALISELASRRRRWVIAKRGLVASVALASAGALLLAPYFQASEITVKIQDATAMVLESWDWNWALPYSSFLTVALECVLAAYLLGLIAYFIHRFHQKLIVEGENAVARRAWAVVDVVLRWLLFFGLMWLAWLHVATVWTNSTLAIGLLAIVGILGIAELLVIHFPGELADLPQTTT